MSTVTEFSLPPAGQLYGPFYFGTILSTAFYGIACMQTFFYYFHYQNDPPHTKFFVAILWALNTIHEALCTSGTYKYLMAGLLNPLAFLGRRSPDLMLILTASVAILAQGFLVHRIYTFSGKNIIAPVIWIFLAIFQLVCITMYVGKALYIVNGVGLQVHPINVLVQKPFTTLIVLCLSVSAAVDILIALCMTFLLVRSRGTTRSRGTLYMLQRLIIFSVISGIWTATFALLTLILLHLFPNTPLDALPGIPVCPVYCNTILSTLNARVYISNGNVRQSIADLELFQRASVPLSDGSTRVEGSQSEVGSGSSKKQQCLSVWKTTEVFIKSDPLPPVEEQE